MTKTLKTIVAAALFAGLASLSFAGPGAQYFTRRIQTTKDAEAMPPDAPMAMACAKCKTVVVVTPGASHRFTFRNEKHECPGCKGEITTDTNKDGVITHTCSKCGSDSAYCCAMTADAAPMPGM